MTPNVSSNPGCYVQHLGDCRGPVNREHVVSRALLEAIWQGESSGSLYGLTFLCATPDEPAQLGINALTAKILCERHNGALNPFDAEIVKFFRAMERLVLDEIKGEPVAVNSYICGDFIERWMFKTLINGLFSGNFPVPFVNSFAGQLPPDEALQIIYRNTPFPNNQGIYLTQDLSRVDHHVFRLEVVGHPTGIVGLRMWILGSLFSLVLTDECDAFPELVTATYRPKKIVSAKTRNAIELSWAGKFSDTALEMSMSNPPNSEKRGQPTAAIPAGTESGTETIEIYQKPP
jgi:hypothetical protein